MKKYLPLLMLFSLVTGCGKKEESPKVTPYAQSRMDEKKEPTPVQKQEPKQEEPGEKVVSYPLEPDIKPSKVAVMPLSCPNGSYAPCNYQNRHFFPALLNALLEVRSDIRLPRRNAVINTAKEKKLISSYGLARRDSEFGLKHAGDFAREIKADRVILPSLFGNDEGEYRLKIRIVQPGQEVKTLSEKNYKAQSVPLDFFATYELYEQAAFETADYLLGNTSAISQLQKSGGTDKAGNLVNQALAKKHDLSLSAQEEAVHLLCHAVKEDPRYPDAWAALSETYTLLANNLYGTQTDISRDMALRSLVAAAIALRLDPENPAVLRAAYLAYYVNCHPLLQEKYRKAYMKAASGEPLSQFLSSPEDDLAAREKAFATLENLPCYLYMFSDAIREESAIPAIERAFEKQASSTFLCTAIRNAYESTKFPRSRSYALIQTYLAQRQFLESWLPWLKNHPQGKAKAEQIMNNLKGYAARWGVINEKQDMSISEFLDTVKNLYFNSEAEYFEPDSFPFQGLKVCRELEERILSVLNSEPADSAQFFDSLDLTPRDCLALWERELLRGPLSTLYLVGQNLFVPEVAQRVVPELEKVFPDDLLVLNAGFSLIYKVTGLGPTGTKYLTKMKNLDYNNITALVYQQDNYISKSGTFDPKYYKAFYFVYIATDPGNSSVLARAYDHLFRLEDLDLAKKVLLHYKRLFPSQKWALGQDLVMIRFEQKRSNTREEIQSLYGADIKDPYAIWSAAQIYRANGFFDEALEYYIKAFEKLPKEVSLAEELGWSWRLKGQPEKFVETIEKCILENGHILKSCSLNQDIGFYYFFQGEPEKARPYYEQSNNIDSWQGGSINGRAYLAYAAGDKEKAKAEFETCYARYNQSSDPETIVMMYLKDGKLQEAKQYIEEKLQDPKLLGGAFMRYLYSDCMYRLGEKDRAWGELNTASKIYKSGLGMSWALGRHYLRLGQTEEAIKYLENVKNSIRLGLGGMLPLYQLLAEAYLQRGTPQDAMPYLTLCRIDMLDNDENMYLIGLYNYKIGQKQEARNWLTAVLNVAPEQTRARATLVLLELDEGNIDAAVTQGEKGMKCCIFKDDTYLYYALGLAYEKKGRKDKAKPLLEKVFQIDGADSFWGKKAAEIKI
jgi:tetratricopeptide (TPR) repeat protein